MQEKGNKYKTELMFYLLFYKINNVKPLSDILQKFRSRSVQK